ncbi:MAG: leucine-rich repeat protein [Paludibacteraceae bacterium]|nr:leucine-rich repeat protein [Paludibacteraceae bacterium]
MNRKVFLYIVLLFCFQQVMAEPIRYSYDAKRDSLTFTGEGTLEQKHVKQALAKYPRTKIVYVGGNVSSVGYEAFNGCNNVETIIFSPSVLGSGYAAIRNCKKLSKVVLPENYKNISCFLSNCPNLESFVVPDSVKGIKELSGDCPFRKLHIGQNLIHTVGDYGIRSKRLASITVSPGNKLFFSQDEVLYKYYRVMTYSRSCDSIKEITIVKYPPAKEGNRFVIPPYVMYVEENAFDGCQFDTLVFPESIKKVFDYAVTWCPNLRCIEMHWQDPNEVFRYPQPFDEINTSKITLKVPKGTKDLYIDLFNTRRGYQFRVEEDSSFHAQENDALKGIKAYKDTILDAQNLALPRNKEDIEYDKTIRLIFDYNSVEHEFVAAKNGTEIAKRVYAILYNTDDTLISKERKMDLLHRMILLECFAVRAYRDMLDFDKNFDMLAKHPEYCIPLMCGYYANMEQYEFIDIDSFENNIDEFVPPSYVPYYRQYLQIVRMKRAGKKFPDKESPFYALMLQLAKERKLNILNNHEVNLENGYFWLW